MNMITTDRDIFTETIIHRFNKNLLTTALTLAMGTATSTAGAALSSGNALQFVLGTMQTVGCNYGTTPPCTMTFFNITDIVGSYFAFDQNNNGITEPREKTPVGSFNGIVIGATQPAGNSHSGSVNGNENPNIDKPWTFFGNTGMHQTVSPVTVLSGSGNTQTLDMNGWRINWNAITVPMVQSGDAVVRCDTSCNFGENYTLDAAFHTDGAGFTSVPYRLHLEGSIDTPQPLPPAVSIDIAGGSPQECDIQGGNNISMSASVFTQTPGDVALITWFLDDEPVGQGATIDVFVPLGVHTVKVNLDTTQSGSAEKSETIVVQDTQVPEISLGFLDAKNGHPLSSDSDSRDHGRLKVKILAEATDVCDPEPVVSATVGIPAETDDVVTIKKSRKKSSIKLSSKPARDALELSVQAEDASSNKTSKTTSISIN